MSRTAPTRWERYGRKSNGPGSDPARWTPVGQLCVFFRVLAERTEEHFPLKRAHDRDRTGDLILTKDVLCRLSYVSDLLRQSRNLIGKPSRRQALGA